MYGVGAVKYKDFVVGYIEKNSFDMGGQKPESAKIEAEQVPGTPVYGNRKCERQWLRY